MREGCPKCERLRLALAKTEKMWRAERDEQQRLKMLLVDKSLWGRIRRLWGAQ